MCYFLKWIYHRIFCYTFNTDIKIHAIVNGFRTSLWYDQAFLILLVPMIVQVIFRASKKLEVNPAVKRIKWKNALIEFIFSLGVSLSIMSYAFFAGSVLLIIPIDNPITRNPNINFGEFTFLMMISGYIASFISLAVARSKKYFKDNNDANESDYKIFSLENKIVIMSVSASLSMIVFFLTHHAY